MDRPESASAPAQWLWALVRNDGPARERLGKFFTDAELAQVVDAAFSLAVKRRFSKQTPISDITRQMMAIRQRYGKAKLRPILEMEMAVRRELGERVPIDDLDTQAVSTIKMFVFEQIVINLGLFDDELDELIIAADASTR